MFKKYNVDSIGTRRCNVIPYGPSKKCGMNGRQVDREKELARHYSFGVGVLGDTFVMLRCNSFFPRRSLDCSTEKRIKHEIPW